MIALALADIASIVGGRLTLGGAATSSGATADTVVDGSVETDSRLVHPGSLFFALPGEVTDGRLFVTSAVENGAALVVSEGDLDEVGVPVIVVDSGLDALAALAREVVARVRAAASSDDRRMRVVGITGSNGKTSTKNMLRAILSDVGETVAPEGSFNNQVGAPISMLRITHDTRFLVVEMGASGPGEIARLITVARPDTGVVLKVGLAHAGGFGGIEGTRTAKAEMVTDLTASDVAILNADDFRVASMADDTRARVVTFGFETADYTGTDVDVTAAGTTFTLTAPGLTRTVSLRILGEHHVMNALAALAVTGEWGLDVDRAATVLEGVTRAERWRMEVLDAGSGVTVINDAYNASPDSVAAALKTLAQITGPNHRSVAVLGEMAELGEFARDEHDRIGRIVVRLNIHKLVVVGDAARHVHMAAGLEGSWDGESMLVPDLDAAYEAVHADLREGDIVLVKSSKSANLRFLGDRLAGVTS